jgi:prepilin-type N-terminal cleavage/methylation domain-containing protein
MFYRSKIKLHKGFTLIELLVVCAIIALIAILVLVNLNFARQKSRDARRKADLLTMQSALEQYYSENKSYPATYPSGSPRQWWGNCSGWVPKDLSGPNAYIPDITPGFISVLPKDPLQINNRCYLYASEGTNYKLLAHNINTDYINKNDPMVDPVRDGGTADCIVNVVLPRSYAVFTPGACGW